MFVYLDNASSTKTDPAVTRAMRPYFSEYYGVPGQIDYGNSFGRKSRDALERARKIIASRINCRPEEMIFTSGETESNNLAIKGVAFSGSERNHLITTKIEQESVLKTMESLEKIGCFKVTYLDVDGEGFVNIEKLKKSITGKTLLVSVQHANQEIGTIQDMEKIGRLCRKHNVIFHADASQSFTKIPIDVESMNIDLLTISSDKIHGPRAVGALYVRNGVKLQKLFEGSGEEQGLRPGIQNIPGIVGFAKAVEIAKESDNRKMENLRDHLIKELLKMPDTRLNGPRKNRLCNNVNITFRFVEGESLLLYLDMKGVVVTTGSACYSQNLKPSHVILALGLKHEDAHGSTRFSLSRCTTKEEIDYTIKSVKEVVKRLRDISPFK